MVSEEAEFHTPNNDNRSYSPTPSDIPEDETKNLHLADLDFQLYIFRKTENLCLNGLKEEEHKLESLQRVEAQMLRGLERQRSEVRKEIEYKNVTLVAVREKIGEVIREIADLRAPSESDGTSARSSVGRSIGSTIASEPSFYHWTPVSSHDRFQI
ncbi:hypothetical protein M011DRAFT_466291, partial [Sporormia fimetaria CBS 119925]